MKRSNKIIEEKKEDIDPKTKLYQNTFKNIFELVENCKSETKLIDSNANIPFVLDNIGQQSKNLSNIKGSKRGYRFLNETNRPKKRNY